MGKRADLLARIQKGAEILENGELTPDQRAKYEKLYDSLVYELALLPDEEETIPDDPFDLEPDTTPVPEQPVVDDPSLAYRQMIRGILQPIKEGAKRRGAV